MTLKTLGLRRSTSTSTSTSTAAPVLIREDFDLADFDSVEMRSTYGLDRTPNGPRRFRNRAAAAAVVADEVAPEFIQPVAESDTEIDGIETTPATAVEQKPVDSHPGFTEWVTGELIPDAGPYTASDGSRWMHGVPAFLHENPRPGAKLR